MNRGFRLHSIGTAVIFCLAGLLLAPPVTLAATHQVNVSNFQFTPRDIVINAGDTVEWVWVEGSHTITNGTGPLDPNAGNRFDQPIDGITTTTFSHVFNTLELVDYFCRPHEFFDMRGTITVVPPPTTHTVFVKDFEFTPRDLTIKLGDSVEWRWVEGFHTTTNGLSSAPADSAGNLWNQAIDPGNLNFTFQFNELGTFPYFCIPHELLDMKGTIDVVTDVTGIGDAPTGVSGLVAKAPFPNPFTSSVKIAFSLEREAAVKVEVFDLSGRRIRSLRSDSFSEGTYEVVWDGRDDSGREAVRGIYFARIAVGSQVEAQKLFKSR